MIGYRRGVLQEGRFGWCGRSGMMLSEGYCWGRRNGGFNFYHSGQGPTEIDFDHPVAVCGPEMSEVQIGGIFLLEKDHWVAVRTISPFGVESAGHAWVRIRANESLDGREVPEQVLNLTSKIGYYGRVRLEWEYEPRMLSVRPAVFKIYVADTEGVFDFGFAEGEVNYRENQRHYVWDGQYLVFGVPYRIIVRAETADGVDCGCMRYVIGRADETRPGAVEGARAEMV